MSHLQTRYYSSCSRNSRRAITSPAHRANTSRGSRLERRNCSKCLIPDDDSSHWIYCWSLVAFWIFAWKIGIALCIGGVENGSGSKNKFFVVCKIQANSNKICRLINTFFGCLSGCYGVYYRLFD